MNQPESSSRWRRGAALAALGAGLVLASGAHRAGWLDIRPYLGMLRHGGAAALLLYLATYAALVVLLVPTLPLNLAAGFLWGPWLGTGVSVGAAVSGACVSFLLARVLGREWLESSWIQRAWGKLDRLIERYGWKAVAFTRINPVFPFGPVNYYFGLTEVPLWTFAWSTAAFVLPPSLAFSTVGHAFQTVTLEGASYEVFRAVCLVSAVVTAWTFLRLYLKGAFRDLEDDAVEDLSLNDIPSEVRT